MTSGTSTTPLARRLGLKPGTRCWFHNMPDDVRAAIAPEALSVEEQPTASDGLQCAHLFVTDQARLERELAALQPLMAPNGFIWVSWQAESAISEACIREMALPHGLIDSDTCAVNDRWSGLKLMSRNVLR